VRFNIGGEVVKLFLKIREVRCKMSLLASCAFLVIGSIAPVLAQDYPTKTIQIINPFPPGAVTDIVARILAPKMSGLFGQQVVIVNKAGGGGAVGIQAARDAAPDGYTILVTPPPIVLIPIVNKNSGFAL
jgi:tripartite-type tricarboxylate transporter receptor subunit TctC